MRSLFGSATRLLDIWPSLRRSPVLTHFAWSPLVLAALEANAALVHTGLAPPRPAFFPWFSGAPAAISSASSPYTAATDPFAPSTLALPERNPVLRGLIAVHVRHGDFAQHCTHLARWGARYTAFNEFPGLADAFEPPPGAGAGEADAGVLETYRTHCMPSAAEVAQKVWAVRRARGGALARVYVLTNARAEWLAELRGELEHEGSWDAIVTSRDVRLSWEQRFVAQAVDMAIAQRAEAFVGNGVRFILFLFLSFIYWWVGGRAGSSRV